MILYYFEINVSTLEIKSDDVEYKYTGDFFGHCSYSKTDEGIKVYAQSLTAEEARRLVFEKCLSLSHAFNAAAQEIGSV